MYKFLEYKGAKLPVRTSYYALKMFKEETGRTLEEAYASKEGLTFEDYECLLYYSLKKGANEADQPFTIEKDQVEDIMDKVFFEFVTMIPDFFPGAGGKTPKKVKAKKT